MMKQALLILTVMTAMLPQAQAHGLSPMDINDPDSYTNFVDCKNALGNTIAALVGFDDLGSSDVLKLKNEIKFSPLVQIGARQGPATSANVAQIYQLRGSLELRGVYSASFLIEAGHGNCNVQKMTAKEIR